MTQAELQNCIDSALAANRAGDLDKAEQLAKLVLAELEACDPEMQTQTSVALKADALMYLADNSRRRNDYDSAFQRAQEVVAFAEAHSLVSVKARAWNLLGLLSATLGSYEQALEYYNKVLEVPEEQSGRASRASVKANIGIVYSTVGQLEKALEKYTEALVDFEELGERSLAANVTVNLGLLYRNLGSFDLAIVYTTKALALYEELGETISVASSLSKLGVVYQQLGSYEVALDYFSRSLQIFEELGDSAAVAQTTANLGMVYERLGSYDTAQEFLTKALASYEQLGNMSNIARVHSNIGTLYQAMGSIESALLYLEKASAIYEQLGDLQSVADNMSNIGLAYSSASSYEKALECYKKALTFQEEVGNKAAISILYGNIGIVYANEEFAGHRSHLAEEYFLKAIALSESLGMKDHLQTVYKSIADLYKMEQRWEECFTHFERYHDLEKEVLSQEARNQANLLQQQRHTAEREKEIAIATAKGQATEQLLHKVLPASIAQRLVQGERIADYFPAVSILFADIVGFTPIAARMPARAVLAFLNYVFGEFDRIVKACGCEKIKTIGDGYLAVAGAPESSEDHAERIARLAIEMSKDILLPDEIRKTLPKNAEFSIRIGIHTGPCFGGIVGENRFVYDIYSDAVNTAARMESHGEPGKICVSDEFCFHLQNRMDMTGDDLGGVGFVERDEIEIKGKGLMRTYFLERA